MNRCAWKSVVNNIDGFNHLKRCENYSDEYLCQEHINYDKRCMQYVMGSYDKGDALYKNEIVKRCKNKRLGKDYCEVHKCKIQECDNNRINFSKVCKYHSEKCNVDYCKNKMGTLSKYCNEHCCITTLCCNLVYKGQHCHKHYEKCEVEKCEGSRASKYYCKDHTCTGGLLKCNERAIHNGRCGTHIVLKS